MAPPASRRDRAGRLVVGGLTLMIAGAIPLGASRPAVTLAPPPVAATRLALEPAIEAPVSEPGPEPMPRTTAAAPAPEPRADVALQRDGRTAFSGGYLALTPWFSAPDGVYDVVIHFHGNTELVEQSLALAGISAVFVPQNLGVGSGPYEERFGAPGALLEVLGRVQAAMEKRGLGRARLGRVALTSWSAGYGAVLRILEHAEEAERVDAVLLLDGLHIGRVPGRRAPAVDQIAPYERFARWAVEGRKLFTVTHSDIAPDAFVGSKDTADVLLRRLDVTRAADGEETAIPDLPANRGVLSRERRTPLHPLTVASRGRLVVRGFAGEDADDHVRHLMAMASIALPDLASWWARPRAASP